MHHATTSTAATSVDWYTYWDESNASASSPQTYASLSPYFASHQGVNKEYRHNLCPVQDWHCSASHFCAKCRHVHLAWNERHWVFCPGGCSSKLLQILCTAGVRGSPVVLDRTRPALQPLAVLITWYHHSCDRTNSTWSITNDARLSSKVEVAFVTHATLCRLEL